MFKYFNPISPIPGGIHHCSCEHAYTHWIGCRCWRFWFCSVSGHIANIAWPRLCDKDHTPAPPSPAAGGWARPLNRSHGLGTGLLSGAASHSCHVRNRSPAAGATLLHRPRRTGDEPCRQFHGNGFPGPTQLTPGECGLPAPSSLLQHASAPVRTGSEGQVAGCPRARGEAGEGLSPAFLSPLMFTSRNGLMGR
nr:vesicular, overexpressed in cancer, prosurvival protein 1 isoform X1 [Chlorocebus sabaeus]